MNAKSIRDPLILLFLIVVITLFFRLYQTYDWLLFGHDQDLAAWVVKDIVVDHHFRLIGQETSIGGLFIGGLFYYGLIPFYLLSNMHPIGSIPLTTLIAVLTTLSLYLVNTKLFNPKVGLLSAFIYAISINHTLLDRWSVPTQPTMLWAVWFLYAVFSLIRGNLKVLPILFILIALIWHIHIAFLPLLLLIPLTIILSKTNLQKEIPKLNKKWLISSIFFSIFLIAPLLIFESRHNFQQLFGLLNAAVDQKTELTFFQRSYLVIQNLGMTFLFPFTPKLIPINYQIQLINFVWPIITIGFFAFLICLMKTKKVLTKNESILITSWVLIVFLGQLLTKRPISEYYFYNLLPLPILLVSITVTSFSTQISWKLPLIAMLSLYAGFNFFYFIFLPTPNREYLNIEKTIQYIKADSLKNNYQCLALNFYGEPGAGVGFRYPSWYYKLPLVRANPSIPIYNIAIPPKIAEKETNIIFGDFAIIPPKPGTFDWNRCQDSAIQLLDPNGFTK